MTSERMRRNLERLLDEAEVAMSDSRWSEVADKARAALAIEADNGDALTFLRMAEANLGTPASTSTPAAETPATPAVPQPESFAAGRYTVRRFLGEGGKKRVFLAHDELLDRDVAFALIKTDGLDDVGRERITREAQAMGRLGAHPNLVTIFDIGEEQGAPFVVTELMGGGDVEGVLADGVPPLARTLEIAKGVARGLAFAHAQGIVHRDLKPGNVWLTAPSPAGGDGVAKIGDFGLAVALNRSRLTLHGLMVGTVAYMPPEQALGGEVTPQADLYSLGAMLYELVTGKSPFQGDTPTAVISQHINSTPVAPSWNSERCPPDLEALILKLLAKVPADRPASAAEVLTALELVDPEARSASHSDSQANPLDRLARGVFVGRERELERLRGALDDALAGHGSLVMLVGEPGIGKTRTTQELETYARMRGAKVLWGRAHESAGAPPYWPWLQAARDYRGQTEDEERRRFYQPYAVELQRIFPGLRDLFPNLPEPSDADSEEGAFRLHDALSSFLRTVATETPLVIVLDDLHWADNATLAMLTHITRELGRARVLVLGTYRDTDLDRRHPLSQALAELNREDLFTRIPLRGLTPAETEAYIRRTADVTPAPALVQRIQEETEGNPFFLSEVVNLMAEEGTLSAAVADVQIPEGVRQALGRRLDRLSEEANALLTTLAVVGREFDHALVLALSPHDAPVTLRLVEEALRARVLEETGVAGRYRYRHALMQQTLLEELSAARRVLLHGEIADALLSTYGAEDRDHLTALAEHYAESAVLNPAHARLAASTLRRAAESAASALAWDEGARLYERCLDLVTAAPDRLGEDEGQLWLQLALARFANTNEATAWEAFDRAAGLLEETPAVLVPALIRIAILQPPSFLASHSPLLTRISDALAATPSIEACQSLTVAAYAACMGPAGDDLGRRAADMAGALEMHDPRITFLMASRGAFRAAGRGEHAASVAEFEKLRPLGAAAGALQRVLVSRTATSIHAGDLETTAIGCRETIAVLRGAGNMQLADAFHAAALRDEWRQLGVVVLDARSTVTAPGGVLDQLRAEVAMEGGDMSAALVALPSLDLPFFGRPSYRALLRGFRCRVLSIAGDAPAAEAEFTGWMRAFESASDAVERTFLLTGIDDALPVLSDREFLGRVAAQFDSHTQWRGGWAGTGPDYLRGLIALTLDRLDDAERWFRAGLDWSTKWGLGTIIGRNLYGLAQVEERRANHLAAMEHLDAAGALFAKRGAKLYLDQVIAMKQVLRA